MSGIFVSDSQSVKINSLLEGSVGHITGNMFTALLVIIITLAVVEYGKCQDVFPRNSAGQEGRPIELNCTYEGRAVQWSYYKINSGTSNPIYQGGQVLDGYEGIYDKGTRPDNIIIEHLQYNTAGVYSCSTIDGGSALKRNIQVASASALQCFTNSSGPFKVGDSVWVGCSSHISTNPQLEPHFQWYRNGQKIEGNRTGEPSPPGSSEYFESSYKFTAAREDDGANFECILTFRYAGSSEPNVDDSDPDYMDSNSLSIEVYFPIFNITYEPNRSEYAVGDVIYCHAEGNPMPMYEWHDTIRGTIIYGSQLNITEDIMGFNIWVCTAYNYVNGEPYNDTIWAEFQVGSSGVPVHNLNYAPKKEQYEVGDVISCSAEGIPTPYYYWWTTSGETVFAGHQLHITEEMTGFSTWLCTAENVIDGRVYNISIIVPLQVGFPEGKSIEIIYQVGDILVMGKNKTLMDLPILPSGLKSALTDARIGIIYNVECEGIELVSSLDDYLKLKLQFNCSTPDSDLIRVKHANLLLGSGWVSQVSVVNNGIRWDKE